MTNYTKTNADSTNTMTMSTAFQRSLDYVVKPINSVLFQDGMPKIVADILKFAEQMIFI